MRPTLLALVIGFVLTGCASDRSITGPVIAPASDALLILAEPVSAGCAHHASGRQYVPYYVIDGRVYAPARVPQFPEVNPDDILDITVLKGQAAAARYGTTAGILGVVIVTTRRDREVGVRPAS
jgi:hypothetical protein